jgi:hypothetical protein
VGSASAAAGSASSAGPASGSSSGSSSAAAGTGSGSSGGGAGGDVAEQRAARSALDVAIAQHGPNAQPLGSTNQAVAVFTDRFGRPCKVFAEKIKVEGNTESVWATICRQNNGQWALAH